MPKLLTEAQLSHFREEGYALPFRAMSPDAAFECRRRIEAYEDAAGHDANRTLKIKGHLAFPWLVELGRNRGRGFARDCGPHRRGQLEGRRRGL